MQIINAIYPGAANCSSNPMATPSDLGFNGILGVSPFTQTSGYYSCNSTSCTLINSPTITTQNPIRYLSHGYESGVTFKLPALGNNGATEAVGYAIFGVGSNSDNTPPTNDNVNYYQIATGTQQYMHMSSTLQSVSAIKYGFLDTGSNGIYFNDSSINFDSYGFYTPNSTINFIANNTNYPAGSPISTSFNMANFDNLINNTNNSAFNNIGGLFGDNNSYLDYGLPFFFGKTVYICFTGMTCNGTPGPYWAF